MSAARRLLASGIASQLAKLTPSGKFLPSTTIFAAGRLRTCAFRQRVLYFDRKLDDSTFMAVISSDYMQVHRALFLPCARLTTIPLNAQRPLRYTQRWMQGHRTALDRTALLSTQLPKPSSAHLLQTSRRQVGDLCWGAGQGCTPLCSDCAALIAANPALLTAASTDCDCCSNH